METQILPEATQTSYASKNDLEAQLYQNNTEWNVVPERFKKLEGMEHFAKPDGLTKIPIIDNEPEHRKWDEAKVKDCLKNGKGIARIDLDFIQLGLTNEIFQRNVGDTVVVEGIAKLTQKLSQLSSEYKLPEEVEIFVFREHGKGDEITASIYNLPNSTEDKKNILNFLDKLSYQVNPPKDQKDRQVYSVLSPVASGQKRDLELTTSLGYAYSGENLIRKNYKNEAFAGQEQQISNEDQVAKTRELFDSSKADENDDEIISIAKKLIRVMTRDSERRSDAMKFMDDLKRLNGELFEERNALAILENNSDKFGDTRITDNVLDNLLVYAATKGALLVNDELEENSKDPDLQNWIKDLDKTENEDDKRKVISSLRQKFFSVFGKGVKRQSEALLLTRKTYDEYKDMASNQLGNDWNKINSNFKISSKEEEGNGIKKSTDTLMENDPEAMDSRFGTGFYTNKTRTFLAEKMADCIKNGKNFAIGSVDANALKRANLKGSYPLGDVYIERHASLVSDAFDPEKLGLSAGAEVYLVSRDAAGDEFIVAAYNTNEEDIKKLKLASEKLNEVRETFTYDPQNNRKFTFSTTSSFVSDSDLGDEIEKTKKELSEGGNIKSYKAYSTFEKAINQADSNVKMTKTIFELENLPLENLVKEGNVYDSIRLVCDNLGGGRIRKEPLKLIMATILTRSSFEYCKAKGIGYDSAWKLYNEVFSENSQGIEDKNMKSKRALTNNLKNLFEENYAKNTSVVIQ